MKKAKYSNKQQSSRLKAFGLWLTAMFCLVEASAMERDSLAWSPEFGLDFTTELQATSEGKFNCANLLRLDAQLPMRGGWAVELASMSTFMTSKESIGGDLQVFSNLDAGNVWFTLAVCGVRWEHEDKHRGAHCLSMGIRNMNEDYFTSPLATFFTNSSCGIFPTISANYPIANSPWASLGVHYRYCAAPSPLTPSRPTWAVQASLYNGVGYTHFTGRENMFRFCPQSDGVFALAQVDYERQGCQYFMGTSLHCADGNVRPSLWAYAEQRLSPKLTLIASYGHAFGSEILCRNFCGVGMQLASRRADFGLFTDYTRILGIDEWATELTCQIPLWRIFTLQPTLHLVTTDTQTRCFGLLRLNVSI